jgi:hypothetical protein
MSTSPSGAESRGQLPLRCPICGQGELVDINYNQPTADGPPPDEPMQEADSRQVATYSCGHEVLGPRIDRAAQAGPAIEIERRTSEDTVPPPETQGDGPTASARR